MQDDMGDRLKEYEAVSKQSWPRRLPLILRFDGVHFHSQVRRWKCVRPFDTKLDDVMQSTMLHLCEIIPGAVIGYKQSDEISILVRDDMKIGTRPWFCKEIPKILSVSAAMCTNAFNRAAISCGMVNASDPDSWALFDCRGFVLPENEVFNAFLWRQQDATRNSVSMLAQSYFSHNRLDGMSHKQKQEMLITERGVNWNDLPTHLRRGAYCYKVQTTIEADVCGPGGVPTGEKIQATRNKWSIDLDPPILTQDREYINRFCHIAKDE